MDKLNLSRTAQALQAYDDFDATVNFEKMNHSEANAAFTKIEQLAEAVGEAFGLDSSDRNNPATCKQIIRPGPKVPGPGCELSFVRKLVKQWQKEQQ